MGSNGMASSARGKRNPTARVAVFVTQLAYDLRNQAMSWKAAAFGSGLPVTEWINLR